MIMISKKFLSIMLVGPSKNYHFCNLPCTHLIIVQHLNQIIITKLIFGSLTFLVTFLQNTPLVDLPILPTLLYFTCFGTAIKFIHNFCSS